MKNAITGTKITRRQAANLAQLRLIRRNARKAARSGNPAKREPARRVLAQLPGVIRATLLDPR